MNFNQLMASNSPFRWTSLHSGLANRAAHFAMLFPLFGYIILFSDAAVSQISFDKITNSHGTILLSSPTRLRYIYFGLLVLAFASVAYRRYCPASVFLFGSLTRYRAAALEKFSISELVAIYQQLEEKYGYGNFGDVPYSQSNLIRLFNDATPATTNLTLNERINYEELWFLYGEVNARDKAIKNCSEFVIHLVEANFLYQDHQDQILLRPLFGLAILGYALLAIPSFDVFLSIIVSLF